MATTHMEISPASRKLNDESHAEATASDWRPLYRIGGGSALTILGITVIQIIVFILWPPPGTVSGYFALFHRNWLLGLLSLDLLYIIDTVLVIPIYLALYVALRQSSKAFITLALIVGLVGIAAYFASNPAFEMLSLSNQYTAATTETQRSLFLAAGQTMLAIYQGSAFDVYYILNAIATLIISVVMLRSRVFGKPAAYAGIASGVLMFIPSTAGTIGLYFAFASLVPMVVWMFLIALRLFKLGQGVMQEEAKQPALL